MSDLSMPKWILEERQQMEQESALDEARIQKQRADRLVIELHSPQFLQDLVPALELNLSKIKAINSLMSGRIDPIRHPDRGEHVYRLQVVLQGSVAVPVAVDVHFGFPQADCIRCVSAQGECTIYWLNAKATGDAVGAVGPGEFYPMSASQLAEDIVKSMVRRVRELSRLGASYPHGSESDKRMR